MRAIVVTEPGGPEVLRYVSVADPRPGPGEVLVAVEAAGVNFIDVQLRSGRYPARYPLIPGQEAAGRVVETGPGVDGLSPGDRVGWVNLPGAYAELAVIPAVRAVPLPDDVDATTAATVLLQGMTAHYLVHDSHRVRPGETVLVQAAAGGLGQLLVRWVKLLGGRVIGTASSVEKARAARDAGADEVIGYEDVPAQVRRLTGGEGVAAVYDGVGGPTFEGSLGALRPRGTLVMHGRAGGAVPPLDLERLNAGGSLSVTRPNLDHFIVGSAELRTRAAEVLDRVATGELTVSCGTVHPLERAADAHARLESRRSTGKLLLTT
ncbi:quinone oxidoreductase family protein [Streptomyces sp. E-08]|uniref:quinone oxidoreductase family protein n=1 Tax=Streptomyces sp. E-08 TaxID=3404047 RepID=UPI003CFB0AFF